MPYDCFLSYSSADLAIAGRIAKRLAAAGLTVWFDKVRLKPGDNWHEKIESDCESSRIVLPILTPRWKESEWTKFETYGAEHIIPVLVEGEWEDLRTPPLDRSQAVHLPEGRGSESSWQDLLEKIAAHLKTAAPEKARRLAHIRHLARPDHFVGRDRVLTDLHERFFRTPTAALTQGHPEVVAALGGVGKTTIARYYCEKFWRCYRQIFWVDCRAGTELGFAQIHDALREQFHELPVPEKAQWALRELSQRGVSTLLVLDNAEDEESAVKWIPNTGVCHTLITSRFTAWSTVEKYEIWVLEEAPSVELLMLRSGRKDTERDTPEERAFAKELAKKLGYLPLALEQAAAYVREQGPAYSFGKYLDLFASNEKQLLERKAPGMTDYPDSVYLTWRATIDKLPAGARAILRLHSFMAATPFPFEVYLKGAEIVREELRSISDAAGDSPVGEFELREWKAALARYSMIRLESDSDAFSMHALTQAVERYDQGNAAPATLAYTAALLARLDWPTWEQASRALWNRLIAHGEAIWVHANGRNGRQNPKLLESIARAHWRSGDYWKGVPFQRAALEQTERILGPEHLDTLSCVNNLAFLLESKGDYAAAEPLYRRALEASERVLGPEHPHTLTCVNNVASLLENEGNGAAAEPLYRRALEASERVLGPQHPNTLISLGKLAGLLASKGDYAASQQLYCQVLRIGEQVLGPEHPDTLMWVNDFAALLYREGNYTAAEPLYRRSLEASERVLGPEHPHTLASVGNLALLLQSKGDYAAAELLYRRALEASERVLGREHPNTLISVGNLALLLQSKGDYATAEPLSRYALEALERVLGPEHPNTLTLVYHLAFLLQHKRDYEAAELLYHRALEGCERVLGIDHPTTRLIARNLRACLKARGESA